MSKPFNTSKPTLELVAAPGARFLLGHNGGWDNFSDVAVSHFRWAFECRDRALFPLSADRRRADPVAGQWRVGVVAGSSHPDPRVGVEWSNGSNGTEPTIRDYRGGSPELVWSDWLEVGEAPPAPAPEEAIDSPEELEHALRRVLAYLTR